MASSQTLHLVSRYAHGYSTDENLEEENRTQNLNFLSVWKCIPGEISGITSKVAICLYYLKDTGSLSMTVNTFGVHTSTASKVIRNVFSYNPQVWSKIC